MILAAVGGGCQAIASIDATRVESLTTSPEKCDEYCNAIGKVCSGDSAVYPDPGACQAACLKLPPRSTANSNNSVECRYAIVDMFSGEPTIDCPAAGPGGADHDGRAACGSNCESYCWLMSKSCNAHEYLDYWLGDVGKCVAACQGIRDRSRDDNVSDSESVYTAGAETARDHNGDSVQCRLFHAVAASTASGAATHCWHAALSPHADETRGSSNPCGKELGQVAPRCEDYCRLVDVACSGDRKVYDSVAQCNAGCQAAFIPGTVEDDRPPELPTHLNTLGCRYTHAYNALVAAPIAAQTHCGHASPAGDGMCGSACESYCAQLATSCSSEAAEKGTTAQCVQDCETQLRPLPDSYSIKLAQSGTSPLACRIYALTQARANVDKPELLAMLCQQAAGKGACM